MYKSTIPSARVTSTLALLLVSQSVSAIDYLTTLSNETRWDSNIFRTSDETDDFINTLGGEIEARHSEGLIVAQALAHASLIRYFDKTDENAEDFGASASLAFPSIEEQYPYFFELTAGFSRASSPEADVGEILKSDTVYVNFDFEYDITERYGIDFETSFSTVDFNSNTSRDFETAAFTLGGHYDYSEKLRLKSGYTYTSTDVDGPDSASSDTHTFFLGAEGDLFARSTGRIIVGTTYREFEESQFDSDTSFFSDIGLTWHGSELWSVDIALTNDFDTGVNNQSRLNTEGTVSMNFTPNEKFAWGVSVFAANLKYDGDPITTIGPPASADRTDTEMGASASANYILTEDLTIGLSAEHTTRDSDFESFEYDQTTVAAQITFTF